MCGKENKEDILHLLNFSGEWYFYKKMKRKNLQSYMESAASPLRVKVSHVGRLFLLFPSRTCFVKLCRNNLHFWWYLLSCLKHLKTPDSTNKVCRLVPLCSTSQMLKFPRPQLHWHLHPWQWEGRKQRMSVECEGGLSGDITLWYVKWVSPWRQVKAMPGCSTWEMNLLFLH